MQWTIILLTILGPFDEDGFYIESLKLEDNIFFKFLNKCEVFTNILNGTTYKKESMFNKGKNIGKIIPLCVRGSIKNRVQFSSLVNGKFFIMGEIKDLNLWRIKDYFSIKANFSLVDAVYFLLH